VEYFDPILKEILGMNKLPIQERVKLGLKHTHENEEMLKRSFSRD
jgi:hypothetical protein